MKECGGEEVKCIKQRLELLYCKIERLGTGFLPRQDAYLDRDRCLDGRPALALACLPQSFCCRPLPNSTAALRSACPTAHPVPVPAISHPHSPPPSHSPQAVALSSHRPRARVAQLLCSTHFTYLSTYFHLSIHPSPPIILRYCSLLRGISPPVRSEGPPRVSRIPTSKPHHKRIVVLVVATTPYHF